MWKYINPRFIHSYDAFFLGLSFKFRFDKMFRSIFRMLSAELWLLGTIGSRDGYFVQICTDHIRGSTGTAEAHLPPTHQPSHLMGSMLYQGPPSGPVLQSVQELALPFHTSSDNQPLREEVG